MVWNTEWATRTYPVGRIIAAPRGMSGRAAPGTLPARALSPPLTPALTAFGRYLFNARLSGSVLPSRALGSNVKSVSAPFGAPFATDPTKMGIRISAYAVATESFEALLDLSPAEALRFHATHGLPQREMMFIDEDPRLMYTADPRWGIHVNDEWHTPEKAPLEKIPLLAQSLRQYLTPGLTVDLEMLLYCFSVPKLQGTICCITQGYKRWWIGSLFETASLACGVVAPTGEWASHNRSLTPADYGEASRLFRNLLRTYNVEPPLPSTDYGREDIRFPIVPVDEDPWMNTWSASECAYILSFIETLLSDEKLRFREPKYFRRRGHQCDEEWHNWVTGRLEEMLQLRDVRFEDLTVVSFIG